ncbi:MAG: 2-C-methyl-D-erythritol 4-phosphate cytidylyltransferase [Clostridia bacterium]|nr:2-C-methyl-D-erythritol 4-phosphate cytidylyltransferase [Clostridia bacterium]
MANVCLLIAGGSGNRMHQDIPKQFLTVNERPVIVYTLEAFQKHPEIDALRAFEEAERREKPENNHAVKRGGGILI